MRKSLHVGNRPGKDRNKLTRYFSIAQVAEHVGVCTRTVRRWIDDKLLKAHRIVGVVRISEDDLQVFLNSHRV